MKTPLVECYALHTKFLTGSRLQPLTVEQRVWIAIAALKFFQPMQYRENCQKIGQAPEENIIRPLDTLGFLKYLAADGVLPEKLLDKPERYLQRINELLARLVFSGHLASHYLVMPL